MKTKQLIISIICLLVIYSCEKNDEISLENELLNKTESLETSAKSGKSFTIPFKFDFYTKKVPSYDDPNYCSDPEYGSLNRQEGGGIVNLLGKFNVEITFCGSNVDFTYKYGTGAFIAANGDEIHIEMAGEVLQLFGDPFYELYFTDPFTIIGGTGRFEGATGSGMTTSYVDLVDGGWANFPAGVIPDHQTDHSFTGTITLTPGSKSK